MKYETVLLDADGTLFDYDKAEEIALKETLESYGEEYGNEHLNVYNKINKALWKQFERGEINSSKLTRDRFEKFLCHFNLGLEAEQFNEVYLDHLGNVAELLEGALEAVRVLAKDFTLVLVTNGISRVQRNRYQQSQLKRYIKYLVISEEVGSAKPNSRIFQEAMSIAGQSQKEKTLMVGDNLNADIKGGRDFGLDTCWCNLQKKKNKTSIVPTYEIHNLIELITVVKCQEKKSRKTKNV